MSGKLLCGDDRGIEGLPVRLVVAVAVGAAVSSMLLGVMADVEPEETGDVTVEASEDELVVNEGLPASIDLVVVDENGNTVPDATVLVESNTAEIDPVYQAATDSNGETTLNIPPNRISLLEGQEVGTLEVSIVPPSDSNWEDTEPNPDIVVVEWP